MLLGRIDHGLPEMVKADLTSGLPFCQPAASISIDRSETNQSHPGETTRHQDIILIAYHDYSFTWQPAYILLYSTVQYIRCT